MMTVIKAASLNESKEGHVLYGNNPDTGRWFERWYSSRKKAEDYATRRNWEFQNKKRVNGIEVAI